MRWECRSLVPCANEVWIVDARTLDRIGRSMPWLREGAGSSPDLLGGHSSAVFDRRRQLWVRVPWWRDARDHGMKHVWTLGEHVQTGAVLLFDRGDVSVALCDALRERGAWGCVVTYRA
jgi:hypothetical protein